MIQPPKDTRTPKERQTDYLKQMIAEFERELLLVTVNYETASSLYMAGKQHDDLLPEQTKFKKKKDVLEVQLRQARVLLEKIENGQVQI